MATIRFSVNPQDRADQVVQAVGSAVVSKNIELTIDVDALTALTPSMSGTHQRLQIILGIQKILDFLETGNKASLRP